MSIINFLKNENINLLWEVLKEEEILKNQNQYALNQIIQIFKNNLKGFYESEKNKCTNLVEINKKYIILILSYINQNYQAPNIQPNKIQIHEETPRKELITFEELKQDKQNQFDMELIKRQEEFTNLMSVSVPSVPDFSDKFEDNPITAIEEEIKKITAQRNYEIEQINKNYSKQYDNNWLNPLETSIKNEKLNHPQILIKDTKQIDNNNNDMKYIKIENEILDESVYKNQVVELNTPKKNISWANNIAEEYSDINSSYKNNETHDYQFEKNIGSEENVINNDRLNDDDVNLFNKLKKKSIKSNNTNTYENTNIQKNSITYNEENDIKILKKEIVSMNNKINVILDILKKMK